MLVALVVRVFLPRSFDRCLIYNLFWPYNLAEPTCAWEQGTDFWDSPPVIKRVKANAQHYLHSA